MNWSPTALLIFLIIVLVTISVFGGYFGYLEDDTIGGELPSGWSLVTAAASFYGGMLIFNVEDVPWIFGIVWWVLNVFGLYCIIKIIWPGA